MGQQSKRFIGLLAAGLTAILLNPLSVAAAGKAEIVDFRLADKAEFTRLVFDLSAPVEHSLFTLNDPERVVIDIRNADLRTELPSRPEHIPSLAGIRNAPRNGDNWRVVLDLSERVRPKSFMLRPSGDAGHRLVIDLFRQTGGERVPTKRLPGDGQTRDVVVVVDAGHGGKDPGAIGRRGTREKHVALAIARKLAGRINRERGMKAVLTRDGDYYLGLRERIQKARQHKADLFISIHADAFKNSHAKGSSVYALSLRGASSEAAQWLARRENESELVGGVNLGDKDELVASVLLDLSQTATIQSSLDVGGEILDELGRYGHLNRDSVQQAGFIVLKSPDIPSVLVETAFISNPEEERKLNDRRHQARIAESILEGVKGYFQRKAPPGTYLARQNRGREALTAASW